MFLNIELCNSSGGMWAFYILKVFISIVCTVIPLIIIMNAFSSLLGSVISAEKIKEHAMQIMKSVIAGLIVFFIPTIMNFVFGTLIEFDGSSFSECYTSSSMEKVNSLREKEAQEQEEKRRQEVKERENAMKQKAEDEKNNKENMERNEKADETKPSSSGKAGSLFAAAKKADERTFNNGYHYAHSVSFDGTNMKDASGLNSASCDRGVALTLYLAGYTDMKPSDLSLGNLDRYLQEKGWTRINSCSELQPGDVVFYDRDHNGSLEASDHTFLIGEEMGLHYDWGSDARIKHQGQFSGGMPFHENVICGDFGWAYREK